jgi:hypothetical protein
MAGLVTDAPKWEGAKPEACTGIPTLHNIYYDREKIIK